MFQTPIGKIYQLDRWRNYDITKNSNLTRDSKLLAIILCQREGLYDFNGDICVINDTHVVTALPWYQGVTACFAIPSI